MNSGGENLTVFAGPKWWMLPALRTEDGEESSETGRVKKRLGRDEKWGQSHNVTLTDCWKR